MSSYLVILVALKRIDNFEPNSKEKTTEEMK